MSGGRHTEPLEAEALARDAVRRGEEELGQRHEATLGALLALAWVRSHTSPAQCEQWIREIRDAIGDAVGRVHPLSWSAQHLLVLTLRTLGQWKEAEEAARDLIASRTRHQGTGHPHTLRIRCDLALVLHAAGQQQEAIALADEVLQESRQVLGPQHPDAERIRLDHQAITSR
ncbi:tetratricopeptide repeat protein [Streptomyces sp. NPDC091280]|uniref:tetratricopeptide repeat protein n=1 Tax=Streptomyces sp. NPDC091280 TaxID=3365984 RepID=UPI003826175D